MIRVEIDKQDPTRLHVESLDYELDLVRQLPGFRYRNKRVTIPLSWASWMACQGVLGNQLEVGPEFASWTRTDYETRVQPCLDLRNVTDVVAEGFDDRLRPFQRAGVAWLSLAQRGVLGDDMGAGKLQGVSYPVLTPSGWRTMGDLKVGDYVIGSDGKPTEVLGVYPQGEREIVQVTFNDGAEVECGWDHLWTVMDNNGRSCTATTRQMYKGETISHLERTRQYNHQRQYTRSLALRYPNGNRRLGVPMLSAPVEFDPVELPIDPYVLGAWLGDGSSLGGAITSGDPEILIEITRRGYELGSDTDHREHVSTVTILGLRTQLRLLGVLGNKHVPEIYLRGSVEQRLDLLRGLMDTDGDVRRRRGNATFNNSNERLIDAVIELVRSLGKVARKTGPRRPTYTYRGEKKIGAPAWRVNVKLPPNMNPFFLSRKSNSYRPASKYPPARMIDSIESMGKFEDSVCIYVDRPDHLYITHDYVLTHNTVQSLMALQRLQSFGHTVFPALITCPASVRHQWEAEVATWLPEASAVNVSGTPVKRRKLLETEADIYIMSWDSLRAHSRLAPFGGIALKRCSAHPHGNEDVKPAQCEVCERELNKLPLRTVIADEIHFMKEPTTKWTRAMWAIMHDPRRIYKFGLSGTIAPNDVSDLWAIMHGIAPEEYPTKSSYVDRYALQKYNFFKAGYDIAGLNPATKDEFLGFFDARYRRMPKDLVLKDLPPIVRVERLVEMSAKQKRAYKELESQSFVRDEHGDMIIASDGLVKQLRLLQYASATCYVDDAGEVQLEDPSSKLDVLEEVLAEASGPVVVAAESRKLIELASKRLEKKKIPHGLLVGGMTDDQKAAVLRDLDTKRFRVLLFTSKTGGTGVNMTAANTLVFLERSWSMAVNLQVEGRVHRIGSEQHSSVTIVDITTVGTVERKQRHTLREKMQQLEEIRRDRAALEAVGADTSELDAMESWLRNEAISVEIDDN